MRIQGITYGTSQIFDYILNIWSLLKESFLFINILIRFEYLKFSERIFIIIILLFFISEVL